MTKFKTTLLAAAVAAAAFSAQAAEVTLYGSVSTGVLYQNTPSLTDANGTTTDSTNSFSMESGFWGDSIGALPVKRISETAGPWALRLKTGSVRIRAKWPVPTTTRSLTVRLIFPSATIW